MDADYESSSTNGGLVVSKVTVEWNKPRIKNYKQKFINGLFDMAWDIRNFAIGRAPYVTGALKNSIRVDDRKVDTGTIEVIAGGVSAPMEQLVMTGFSARPKKIAKGARFVNYAAKREQGPNRNPATEHYMQNSLNDVLRGDWQHKYFGGVTK